MSSSWQDKSLVLPKNNTKALLVEGKSYSAILLLFHQIKIFLWIWLSKIGTKLCVIVWFHLYMWHRNGIYVCQSRSSRPEMFCKEKVLRNFTKFTGKHLCLSLTSVFLWILWNFSEHLFLKNTSGGCFCQSK